MPTSVGEHLVAAHADERPYAVEVDAVPSSGQRVHPRVRVRVVAVDEGAVDVEDDGARGRQVFVDIDHDCWNGMIRATQPRDSLILDSTPVRAERGLPLVSATAG